CVNDGPGYEDACQRMLARFADSSDPEVWHLISVSLGLAGKPIVEPSRAVTFAERCVANNKVVWRVANLGWAHYRAGQLDHAAIALKESLAINPLWNPPWIHSVLAMVQHRLGDSEKASAALDKARSAREERVELILAGDVGYWPVPWWDFLHGELLYNEAYALIHGSPPPEDWRLLIHRGRALEAIGRAGEARAVFARAFERQTDELLYPVRRLPPVGRPEASPPGT